MNFVFVTQYNSSNVVGVYRRRVRTSRYDPTTFFGAYPLRPRSSTWCMSTECLSIKARNALNMSTAPNRKSEEISMSTVEIQNISGLVCAVVAPRNGIFSAQRVPPVLLLKNRENCLLLNSSSWKWSKTFCLLFEKINRRRRLHTCAYVTDQLGRHSIKCRK